VYPKLASEHERSATGTGSFSQQTTKALPTDEKGRLVLTKETVTAQWVALMRTKQGQKSGKSTAQLFTGMTHLC